MAPDQETPCAELHMKLPVGFRYRIDLDLIGPEDTDPESDQPTESEAA